MTSARIKKAQLDKLKWYKSRGWTKKRLLEFNKPVIFPRSFIKKYYSLIK